MPILIFKNIPSALYRRKKKKRKKKDDLGKLQFKAEQCNKGKMTGVEKTPSGMWPL